MFNIIEKNKYKKYSILNIYIFLKKKKNVSNSGRKYIYLLINNI